MNCRLKLTLRDISVAAGLMALAASGNALAGAVIYDTGSAATATAALGVNDLGHLNSAPNITTNADATGLAAKFADGSWRDATAPGCLCEGWGVSATSGGSDYSGYANVYAGTANLTLDSFTTDAAAGTGTFITSAVHLTSLPGLSVTHRYTAADSASGMFVARVTIENNTGGNLSDVRYVRVMDWDIPPTEFNEYVTIQGTATTTLLDLSHDNGFASADPLAASSPILPGTLNVDFIDSGPEDHGAYFRFNFGDIADGDSYEFDIFYGAADSETAALAAIALEGVELYSFGQQAGDPTGGTPKTFIFAFAGVGGSPIVPGVPEPGVLGLMTLGMLGMAAVRRRRKLG